MRAEDVRRCIEQGLHCEHVAVQGEDGRHFEAVVVSAAFEGKSRVAQHQLVYRALGERMREDIHALSLHTLTPAAWRGQQDARTSRCFGNSEYQGE